MTDPIKPQTIPMDYAVKEKMMYDTAITMHQISRILIENKIMFMDPRYEQKMVNYFNFIDVMNKDISRMVQEERELRERNRRMHGGGDIHY